MPWQYSVLASGSSGNASLLRAEGFGVLLDLGLGPRSLARRLKDVAASWRQVHAALLTHTHGDHWNQATLRHLGRCGIPLYCHRDHAPVLQRCDAFTDLCEANLVHYFEPDLTWELAPALRCRAFPLMHDHPGTCGFRIFGTEDFFGDGPALAYVADLGCWQPHLVAHLANADILAIEFNHDVHLQRTSGRSPHLVARVLGDAGHLSNEQAAALVQAVLRASEPGKLSHLVQLHLSRDCNRPALARAAAAMVLEESATVHLHTARQDRPEPVITLGNPPKLRRSPVRRKRSLTLAHRQPCFPEWDDAECGDSSPG